MNWLKRIFAINKHEILIAIISIIGLFVYIALFTYIYFAKDLGSKDSIVNRNNTGVILVDRNNKPFFNFFNADFKQDTPLSEISPHIKQAVIVAEDKDFYTHPGFDIKAMIAALIADIKKKDFAYGGSTITQQLVKNSLLTKDKSFLRKYQEIILAQEIDRRYTKDEILEMYLNSVYFGQGAFGVESASQVYFGKSAHDLNIAESALLAGLLTAPSQLNPIDGNKDAALAKQKTIIQKLYEQKYISLDQKKEAEKQKLNFKNGTAPLSYKTPHFALMVKDQLIEKYGEEVIARSGLIVHTSIDLEMQDYAEKVTKAQIEKLKANNASNAAVVVLDPKTGEILAMVGSKDWNDEKFGKINMAISPRQPGSSIKPIIYSAGFEDQTLTPSTVLKDQATTYQENKYSEKYSPKNYDGKFRGPVLPRRALANSLNIPAVEVLNKIGVDRGLEQIKKFGVTTLADRSNYGLSVVLGGVEIPLLQMAGAYAVFANQGYYVEPTAITKIENKYNQTIYKYTPSQKQVMPAQAAFQISSILSDNKARQEVFGNALTINRTAAVKTGTTDDYKDAWTLGYTPNLVIGVWVGNPDNTPMDQVAGSLGAAPIWKELMTKFLADKPDEQFEIPEGMIRLAVCPNNGLRLRESSASASIEYYLTGTEPTGYCSFNTSTPKPTTVPTNQPSQNPQQQNTPAPPSEDDKDKKDKQSLRSDGLKENKPQGGETIIQIETIHNVPSSSPPN